MIQPANAEDLIKRNALIMSLSQHLSPGFSVVPPTVRFPFPAVAHPEMGLCAVFVHESPLILEEGERRWYGAESVDPERAIAEATMELSAAAKAPLDRVTGIAWLPQGYSRLEMPGICTSPAPEDAAAVIEDALSRVPNRTDAPLNPWYANYIVGASGPKGPPSEPVRRISALVEKVLEGIFADKEAVIAGTVLGPAEFEKIEVVRAGGLNSLAIMRDAGLPMAFGSDLLGGLRKYHCMEFELLAKVLTPAEIIRSATTVGADLCRMTEEIGTIAAGAHADLIVVDGDPLTDITRLQDDGAHMPLIMRGGEVFKDRL